MGLLITEDGDILRNFEIKIDVIKLHLTKINWMLTCQNPIWGRVNVFKDRKAKTLNSGCFTFEQERCTHIGINSVSKKACEVNYVQNKRTIIGDGKRNNPMKENLRSFLEEVGISIHIVWIVFSITEAELPCDGLYWSLVSGINCGGSCTCKLSLVGMCAIHKNCDSVMLESTMTLISVSHGVSLHYSIKPHHWVTTSGRETVKIQPGLCKLRIICKLVYLFRNFC